jgi:subtilase family serine protease
MLRTRTFIAAFGATAAVAGLTIVGVSGPAGASPRPASVTLRGSVAPFTSQSRVIGNAAGSAKLSIQVWLQPREAAATRYASEVSTPGSKLFHHYLSPSAYTTRFGATRAAQSKVAAWLRSQGFTGVHADSQRQYVRATSTTAKIDSAFRTTIKLYRSTAKVNAGPYTLRANSTAVHIPSSLASSVIGITGLDNAKPILPLDTPRSKPESRSALPAAVKSGPATNAPCSNYYGQHIIPHLPGQFGTSSFPTEVCGYSATQLRAAYGANWTNTGTGQTVALVELGLTKQMFLTLKDYAAANSLPAPSARRYAELSIGSGTACGDDFDVEEQLDVESSYAMAPGANQLVVGGDSCNEGDFGLQGLFDADVAILDGVGGHPLASVASNSWEGGIEAQPDVLTAIEHAYLLRSAGEGVGMYFSSGDGSGVLSPSSDPDAIAVGGTTLGIGSTNNRIFETGWSTAESLLFGRTWELLGEQGASGGGPSLIWKQPAWQHGVVPTALALAPGDRGGLIRSVPDISADADPFTGAAVGLLTFRKGKAPVYAQSDIGGTSLASPLVAGIVTAAQQGQSSSFGLVTPALFKLAGTSAINDALPLTSSTPVLWDGTYCPAVTCGARLLTTFDDQSPAMFGYNGQVTLKGYDNMTGVGTPAGQAFISALRQIEG